MQGVPAPLISMLISGVKPGRKGRSAQIRAMLEELSR